jgi:diguanylate cyclase (GGDEF)-like protein
VLLPDTPVEGALRVAEQLRRAIAAIDLGLEGTTMTASFGVAVLGLHADDPHALMRAADHALYAAKRGGRDRVEVAEARPLASTPAALGEPEPTAS